MIAPHGGRLVTRVLGDSERARREAELADLPKLHPCVDELYDAEKIAIGAYSPLEGFMDRQATEEVVHRRALPGGLPWTIPIHLAPRDKADQAIVQSLQPGDAAALLDPTGGFVALLRISDKFPVDRSAISQEVYGTRDPNHPNVADLLAAGPTALGGSLELLRRLPAPTPRLELTPAQVREEFGRRGWSRVAAYQCRNPPHTAHEYLQRATLEREDVDGLLVHPVVGRLKRGDYRPEVILECYEALVREYYPPDRVMLSSLTVTMRYGGPRAALFYAIVRKNYGCLLYIVGRDQAGVGSYYDPYACQRIFDELPIDVVPLRYRETFFCRRCNGAATDRTCPHPVSERLVIAQTELRRRLKAGEPLPAEVLRPEVAAILSRPNVLLTA